MVSPTRNYFCKLTLTYNRKKKVLYAICAFQGSKPCRLRLSRALRMIYIFFTVSILIAATPQLSVHICKQADELAAACRKSLVFQVFLLDLSCWRSTVAKVWRVWIDRGSLILARLFWCGGIGRAELFIIIFIISRAFWGLALFLTGIDFSRTNFLTKRMWTFLMWMTE